MSVYIRYLYIKTSEAGIIMWNVDISNKISDRIEYTNKTIKKHHKNKPIFGFIKGCY